MAAKSKQNDSKKSVSVREQAQAASSEKPKRRLRLPKRDNQKAQGKFRRTVGKIGRLIVPSYFRNSWKELRNVSWPDRRTTIKLTFAVIVFAVVFAVLVAVIDYGLDKLFRALIL